MKPLYRSVPGLLDKAFGRKYISLGRIVTHWTELVGADAAARSVPAKIQYFKAKIPGEKARATLEIAASSADCAVLVYQKDVLLQKLEHFFGDRWVTDIKFVHAEPKSLPRPPKKTKSLTQDEKNHLSQLLETVDDPELKERLEKLGQAVLQENRK